MKEPHEEGLASHLDLEPCICSRKGAGEASAEALMRPVLSCEIGHPREASAQAVIEAEGNTGRTAIWRGPSRSPRSQRPGTREETSVSEPRAPVYTRKAGRTAQRRKQEGSSVTGSRTGVMYR